jgi:exonuclease SbcC
MIPIEMKVRGVTVLNDIHVNFSDIPGSLIAITGKNGQGKTSLMESMFLSLYRMLPSRPGVYEFCKGRDALVDFKFDWHGKIYEAVVNIDAVYSKMEAFLYDDQQNPLPGITGKTKDFDAIVAKLFGNSDMVMASSFAAQNKRGSFIKLAKIERKGLFIKMLNLELLQRVTEEFRKEHQLCSSELLAKRSEAATIERQSKEEVPDIEQLKIRLDTSKENVRKISEKICELAELIGSLKSKVSGLKGIQDLIAAETEKYTGFTNKIVGLKTRLDITQKLLESADQVEQANQELSVARTTQADTRKELNQLNIQRRDLQLEKVEYDRQVNELRQRWLQLQSTKKLCEKSIADAQLASATIDEVPCKAEGDFAKCQFLLRATEARENLDGFQVDLLNTTQSMLKIQDEQKAIPKPNADLIANYDLQIEGLERKLSIIEPRIKTLEKIVSISSQVEQAKAKVGEIKEQMIAAEEGKDHAEAAIIKAKSEGKNIVSYNESLVIANNDYSTASALKVVAEGDVNSLNKQITQAEDLQFRVVASSKKLVPIMRDITALERDQKEWSLLNDAFGPSGIQSLEIDAAGPTVSSITNDLLFSCFGPRFSIKFVTQVLKADGNGYKDEFDIIAIDSEKGREGSIDGYSGGEQVVIAESVSLAIAVFNKMKSGVSWQTLFRDETTGALDDENAPRYIQMLRRAKEIGNFQKVCFIAHQDRLKDLADSRIELCNGDISIL